MKKLVKKNGIDNLNFKSDAGGLKEIIALIKGKIFIHLLNMKVEFIEFKEFQIRKHKGEFIPRLRQLQFARSRRVRYKIRRERFKIDVFRSSGPEDKVNTTDSL